MSNVVYFLFIFALGLTLSKSSGKIASVLVTGNPSMGLGDLVSEFRSMGQIAGHAAKEVEHAAQAVEKSVRDAGKDTIGHAQMAGDGAAIARNKTVDQLKTDKKKGLNNMEDEDIKAAGKDAASSFRRGFWKQAVGDKLYKDTHGYDNLHNKVYDDDKKLTGFGATKGYLMPGQSFIDNKGKLHDSPHGAAAQFMFDESNPAGLRVDYDPSHWKTVADEAVKKHASTIARDRGSVPSEEGRE